METESSHSGDQQQQQQHSIVSGPIMISNPILRGIVLRLLQIKTLSDKLPGIFSALVTNGKITALVLIAVYVVVLLLWLPFWLLSFITTEWGIYVLFFITVFVAGRAVIRLIAFPGASRKLISDIETEFAKYSVRMIVMACGSMEDVCVAQHNNNNTLAITSAWRRARNYRNRVLGVYAEVLQYLYQQQEHPPLDSTSSPDLTKYGNNKLSGDIGSLLDVSPQARKDGKDLLVRIVKILALLDEYDSKIQKGGADAESTRLELLSASSELKDFATSLKPPTASSDISEEDGTDEESGPTTIREAIEAQGGNAFEFVKSGFSSILPMLDPPPSNTIFCFDVQRGCMLSRYQGARQIWVRRPTGGKIDVLHFPARRMTDGAATTPNRKAVLYCNPNAGLVEVTAGLSFGGGNVPASDAENSSQDSWVDYYTERGMDLYVFNYAGYGRSYGTTMCSSGQIHRGGGQLSRLWRIFHSCFLSFTPTPDTLRADAVAVAQYLIHDLGVDKLVIHGESIGGVAATGAARYLCQSTLRDKVSLLLCDRTFCNLEAVAQRLVGGWSGYAIRALAPLWNTDVAGDFLAASCPKVVASDAADSIISDAASLKSGISLWKELHRGITMTKGIAWITEIPLQYRMAEWENVCVNSPRYVASNHFNGGKAPTWPADKHISVEEAFHFAACCKRIGKVSKELSVSLRNEEAQARELGALTEEAESFKPITVQAWKLLACCDGLTGAPLGVAVKNGFDATVAWLCACLVFGAQRVLSNAEKRLGDLSVLSVCDSDFDNRPKGFASQEMEGVAFPKPIPEVIAQLQTLLEGNLDDTTRTLSHEFDFALGVLQYIHNRLVGSLESAAKSRSLQRCDDWDVGMFLNLHCGHNNAFTQEERRCLQSILERSCS